MFLIFTTPGRSDFYPKLSLSYDSAGKAMVLSHGVEHFNTLNHKKNREGLPRDDYSNESDTFILSGAEDLSLTATVVAASRPEYEESFI